MLLALVALNVPLAEFVTFTVKVFVGLFIVTTLSYVPLVGAFVPLVPPLYV